MKCSCLTRLIGEFENFKNVLNDLADLHKLNPITAGEFDDLELTAEQFDNKELTAYDFDFNAKTLLSN